MLSDISLCLLSADFYITSYKNIFHVPVRVHVFKPYQNFGPDLSPDCLLRFSVVLPPVVIHDQRDHQFRNRPRVFYQVVRVVSQSVAMTRENIHYI